MVLQSNSSSSSYGFTYDVFLNFRGSDTRLGFTGHLYKALCDSGIHTFIDDTELHRGDQISLSLIKAIEESMIYIPVLSINYASSKYCLEELDKIMESSKSRYPHHHILPVFYDVDPSQVRRQTGSYGKAIATHKKRFQDTRKKYKHLIYILSMFSILPFIFYYHGSTITLLLIIIIMVVIIIIPLQYNKEDYNDYHLSRVHRWKAALTEVASFSGYHWSRDENKYEHEIIGMIVKDVSNKINRSLLHVADYPVELEPHITQVHQLLGSISEDQVCIVGVYGIGGVGKTTLVRVVYNLIACHFEAFCFLHNVRENSAKHGLENLQEKLLSKTIGLNIRLGDVDEGISIIKRRLPRKRVLLVLDDVDELKQLQFIAGGLDWFGIGSRVIVTTRDRNLLASHHIEKTYEVM